MNKSADLSSKLNLQGILKNIQSIISPLPEIPEEAKKDPIAYRLAELTKSIKTLEELNHAVNKEIEKIGAMLGSLYKDWSEQKVAANTPATTTSGTIPTPTSAQEKVETATPPATEETKEK
jgi:hypothetical protein